MRHRMDCVGSLVTLVALLVWLPAAPAAAQQGAANGEWRHYAGGIGSTKYAPLDQINADTVGSLRIAWTRPAVDQSILDRVPNLNFTNNLTNTPLMVDGILYGSNAVGLAEAFDPATGETLWVQEPMDPAPQGYRGAETRGVGYWTDGSDARILVQRGQHLIALNAKTGRPYPDFGDGGRVNLTIGLGPEARYRWTGAPLVVGDVVVMGQSMTDTFITMEAVRAPVRAFDVRTGEQRWEFHTIPRAGEYGTDTWEDDSWQYSGHAPVWSLMSADPELGYVYLPVTSPTSDMYGGHRVGDNLYGQSIVCVDAETGERVWHFQTVHHGLWDYDLPTAPILMDLEVEGRPGITKAVVQLTKQAMAFAFDRATGEPLWPIEERPVPQSDTPGERTSPTQPFPTRPPPFDRHGSNVENLIDFTPELRREALEIVSRYTIGPIFTPPSIRGGSNLGTIQLPGSQGGADVQGRGVRSRDRLPVRAVDHRAVRGRRPGRESGPHQPALREGHPPVDWRAARTAALQAALRSHHGDRHEARGVRLDGAERARPAQPPGHRAPEPGPPRLAGPAGAAAHQVAAVHRRGVAGARRARA